MALGQELDGVGPRIVQAPGELGSRVAQTDDQQVSRSAPALRPGKGAAQGLALFGRGFRCLRLATGLGAFFGRAFLALALALGGNLFLDDDPWRLADGDGSLRLDFGRDARWQCEV